MKRTHVLAGALSALALAGCGTTVPLTQQVTGAAGVNGLAPAGGPSSAAGGSVAAGALAGGRSPLAGSAPGAGGTGAVAGTAGGTGGTGAAVAPSGAAAGKARGVTATTITIGIPVTSDGSAFATSLGISGAGTITDRAAYDAAIADVNRSGGVLGRKLVAYYHEFTTAAYVANSAQVANEVCTDFRDDHPVFAIFAAIADPVLRDCAATMGSPFVGGAGVGAILPASAWDAHGGSWFYSPNAITVERLAKLFVESLMERDFHEKWDTAAGGPGGIAPVKLGVIHVDTPESNALYAAYARELAKHGLSFTDTVTYASSLQAGLAATQNAVLKFRADGITHVYGASAFFLQDAENQKYRPRYAYIPGLGQLGAANSPSAQLKGALTVGWSPSIDVAAAQDPGDTPGAAACRAAMRRSGIMPSNRGDDQTVYTVCDMVTALKAALEAGGAPTVAALRHGFESLGGSLRTALTFNAFLGPWHHYGVDAVRDMAYDSSCSCLKYTSGTFRQ